MTVAIVTGARCGIGAACLRALRAGGVTAIGISRDIEGPDCRRASVLDAARLESLAHTIKDDHGSIDILVNCAAADPANAAGPTLALRHSDWAEMLDVDLTGTFNACRAFGSAMVNQRSGRIVNLTSIHGLQTFPCRSAYAAAKAGVIGLTRALACEWGRYGVFVNAVAPGPVANERTRLIAASSPSLPGKLAAQCPAGRLASEEEVVQAILPLTKEESFVNGQVIVVDGGTTASWWSYGA